MITKKLYYSKRLMTVVLAAAAVLTISSIVALSYTSQTWALEGTSTQTSCVNNQPCQTMVCSESQPCKVSETPNTDFEFDETDSFSQPLEGQTIQQPLEGTDMLGLAPFFSPYNNGYSEDLEEY